METRLSRTVVTYRSVETCAELGGVCFCGNYVNNTTCGVTTIQRTLRTTQRFYPLSIEELRLKNSCRDLVDSVYVNAHARITKSAHST